MRLIVTHIPRNVNEIIEILCKTGTFTCPTLPHYRYRQTQESCRQLRKRGLIKKSGETDIAVSSVASERFRFWQAEYEGGDTALHVIRWQKKYFPLGNISPKNEEKEQNIPAREHS